jgi:hypothetical protein
MYQSCGTPSLASLPREVLCLIEAEIVKHEACKALENIPMYTCACSDEDLWECFMESYDAQAAFIKFCGVGERIYFASSNELSELTARFQRTRTHDKLWEEYKEEHRRQGCAEEWFWGEVADYIEAGDFFSGGDNTGVRHMFGS